MGPSRVMSSFPYSHLECREKAKELTRNGQSEEQTEMRDAWQPTVHRILALTLAFLGFLA